MKIRANRLIKLLRGIIKTQPIHIQRWVLISGDGVLTQDAWSWYYSWQGRVDMVGRGTWQTLMTPAGQASATVLVVVLPYEGGDKPMPRDQIRLYLPNGTVLGTYRVVASQDFTDNEGSIWKQEVVVEILQ